MDVEIFRDGYQYNLHFERGENVGGLQKQEVKKKRTGTRIKWKPDLDVFTDIDVPDEYYAEILKRQAVVNAGLRFVLRVQTDKGFNEQAFLYEEGIVEYVKEIAGENFLTPVQY